jgi:hypothetical protein
MAKNQKSDGRKEITAAGLEANELRCVQGNTECACFHLLYTTMGKFIPFLFLNEEPISPRIAEARPGMQALETGGEYGHPI